MNLLYDVVLYTYCIYYFYLLRLNRVLLSFLPLFSSCYANPFLMMNGGNPIGGLDDGQTLYSHVKFCFTRAILCYLFFFRVSLVKSWIL